MNNLPQMAGHAIADMQRLIRLAKGRKKHNKDAPDMKKYAGITIPLIKNAEHIVLPPDAVIYRDNYNIDDAINSEIYNFQRLPYPLMCFEYPSSHLNGDDDPTLSTRTITIAMDNRYEGCPIDPDQVDDRTVVVGSCLYLRTFDGKSDRRMWFPTRQLMAWRLGLDRDTTRGQLCDAEDGEPLEHDPIQMNQEKIEGNFGLDLSIVLQTCHALSKGARLEEQKDRVSPTYWRMAKEGLGGLVYKVLKIPDHFSVTSKSTAGLGGHHASPRLHQRRGHERRLRSGRIVFVRATMVGDAARGEVRKYYEVTHKE